MWMRIYVIKNFYRESYQFAKFDKTKLIETNA